MRNRMKVKCKSKYQRNWQKFTGVVKCHPNRPHAAKGLCKQCYCRERYERIRPTCHPNNSYHSKAMCSSCYYKKHKAYYKKTCREWAKKPWNVKKVQYNW